ncbi:MAG: adenylyl-sulfate kinase [Bacillota bacterium]
MDEAFTIWLTGLSGSGKTTLSKKINQYLLERNYKVQLLDGDILRDEIGGMFGYTRSERIKAASVYRLLAKTLNDNGINAIVASIAPYKSIRNSNRNNLEKYFEIYIKCSIEECVKRDVKGLYKRVFNGKEKNVVGIDEPFEVPLKHDLQIDTKKLSVEKSFDKIIKFLNNEVGNNNDF